MRSLVLICLLAAGTLSAQDCKVKLAALDSSYAGECKKGNASGKGEAKGVDTYKGDFKNGYPDGWGRYTWSNGDWYDGQWEKGIRSGRGTMQYAKTPKDSLVGFWKKDKYIGKYKEPYLIHNRTHTIFKLDVSRDETSQLKEITFETESITGGTSGVTSIAAKPKVTNIEIIKGTYVQQYDQDFNLKKSSTTLRMVQFPFRARVTFGTDVLEIEILEEGKWKIELKLQR